MRHKAQSSMPTQLALTTQRVTPAVNQQMGLFTMAAERGSLAWLVFFKIQSVNMTSARRQKRTTALFTGRIGKSYW